MSQIKMELGRAMKLVSVICQRLTAVVAWGIREPAFEAVSHINYNALSGVSQLFSPIKMQTLV